MLRCEEPVAPACDRRRLASTAHAVRHQNRVIDDISEQRVGQSDCRALIGKATSAPCWVSVSRVVRQSVRVQVVSDFCMSSRLQEFEPIETTSSMPSVEGLTHVSFYFQRLFDLPHLFRGGLIKSFDLILHAKRRHPRHRVLRSPERNCSCMKSA